MAVERNVLIKQLRMYGNVEDMTDWTDEQLCNMVKGYVKKDAARQYADVCPYFKGVSPYAYGARQWEIGCSLQKGCDISPYELKNWACTRARECFQPIDADFKGFEHCRFFSEEKKKGDQMKQKYICKCGKTFEKESTADTTGYRLGADFGSGHECYGCHFVVPVTPEGNKITDYECRASKQINYQTTADLPRSRDGFHVGRIKTLDMNFARQIWEFAKKLDGQDEYREDLDLRAASFGADGRFELTLYFQKTKAGVASSLIVSDQFFDGGTSRPDMTEEQEKELVLKQIQISKEKANAAPATLSSAPDQTVSNDVQNLRSIDQITLEINFYKAQTAQNIIEIGKRLIEAKQQLQHGEWLPWLRDKVEFTERSAQNFMKVAQEYSKTQPVSYLPYTKLLALLQVPEAEREEFIQATHLVDGQEKAVSDMSKRELEQAIKERNEAQQNERLMRERCDKAEKVAVEAREAKKKEYDNYMNALVKAEKAQETLNTLRGSRQLDLQRITELEKQIKELESRPVDVAVQEPSEAEKQQLRNEGYNNAKELYDMRLQQLRNELEQAKTEARSAAGFDRDEIVCAAASFRDAL
ncbi:MAG TPA: DUF3102 domain-containing protein, partial [Clostridia bacterium]|nr:DUF3102 domain-containing protein [Clostridia bacterium]